MSREPNRPGEVPAATSSGIEPKQVYAPELGLPGVPPFLRGPYPTMYRGRLWTMRQYAGFGDAAATNRRFRYLLEQGQMGLSTAFDLPTQIGYDPDHPMASGEVGRVGVSIACVDDLDELFAAIPLDQVSTSMTINATASILLALYVAAARRQGIPAAKLSGTVQNDILKEYAARGTYRFPPAASMRLVTDVIAWTASATPRWNSISISGYHMREAGCTAVQEVAFTLAHGLAYVQAAVAAGLDVDAFASRVSFFFAAHNDLFEEVAKFRAARRLWARLMQERFAPRKPESLMLRFHTQTGGSTLTAQQPQVNIARVTLQALAAVLGGTQSLHTNSWDEALALPSEASALLALRTQQVIAAESGVTRVVDPLGGSPYVEALTDEIEARARTLIEKIDTLGGAVAAVEAGFVQQEIHRSAWIEQQAIERGTKVVVGVNQHTAGDVVPPTVEFRSDEGLEARRREQFADFRSRRDSGKARDARKRVADAAATKTNLLPLLIEAVDSGATLGELCTDLEAVFGTYRAPVVF
ncbi:MAG: methylmalonyl-CoA mutase [Planctomycetes bacterium]|nr:methylmalonyl-CoA mutase [Planctomycetota bacterium]